MCVTFASLRVLISADCVCVLPAVTGSKEEEARWAEEETLQDAQQPLGRCAGGLFRRRPCEEVKSFPLAVRGVT